MTSVLMILLGLFTLTKQRGYTRATSPVGQLTLLTLTVKKAPYFGL